MRIELHHRECGVGHDEREHNEEERDGVPGVAQALLHAVDPKLTRVLGNQKQGRYYV